MTKSIAKKFTLLFIALSGVGGTGCGSMGRDLKSFLGGRPAPVEVTDAAPASSRRGNTYSENPNQLNLPERVYKRTTQKDLQTLNRLDDRAGSLWVMEGQGAYLFSQNIMRLIGDPLNVILDGEPKAQLETKANVIKDLIKKLEERNRLARARALGLNPDGTEVDGAKPAGEAATAAANTAATARNPAAGKSEDVLPINAVSTRIVERMVDGNYRVRGSQPFMMGPREYKVIVSGIVRAEDFSDDGISAKQLLDPQFDIVAVRKDSEAGGA